MKVDSLEVVVATCNFPCHVDAYSKLKRSSTCTVGEILAAFQAAQSAFMPSYEEDEAHVLHRCIAGERKAELLHGSEASTSRPALLY